MFVRSVALVVSRPREEILAFVADAHNRRPWDDSEELTSPDLNALLETDAASRTS